MRNHALVTAGGVFIGGTFNAPRPDLMLADRRANNQAFPGEKVYRFPRSWDREKCWRYYIAAISAPPAGTVLRVPTSKCHPDYRSPAHV